MNSRFTLGFTALLALAGAISSLAQVPGIITYQGRVISNGTNFNGTGHFRFVIYQSGPPIVSLWSHDNSSVGGSMPLSDFSATVSNGLFTVALGDTNTPGMSLPIPAGALTNSDTRVRIWFDDGTSGVAQLAPDQRLTSAAYAMMSANVPDASITLSKLVPGFWNATNFPANSVTSEQLADSLALGATNVAGRLDVYRTAASTPAISLLGSSSQISTYGSDGQEQIRLYGTGWGELWLNNSLANNATAVRLTAQGSTGGQLELRNTNGVNRAVLEGENTGGTLTLYENDGNIGAVLYGNEGQGSGALSLRGTNGNPRFRAFGGPASGSLDLFDTDGTLTFNADAAEGSEGAQLNMYQANGARTIQLDAEAGANGGGYIGLYENDGTELVTATANGNGSLILRQGDGSTGVGVFGNNGSGGGGLSVFRDNGTFAGQITVASSAGFLGLANSAGVNRFIGVGANAAGGAALYLQDSTGTATIVLDSDSNNEGRVTTQVLEITGGSDLAENFDILSPDAKPGMIVRIDPDHPGQLAISDRPYDRMVAGVVSGAGGIKPGMLMGQRNTAADGKHPIALTGRVYCLVDTVEGAICPGDLITTSRTPGHGMRVNDPARAQGAIIGKAMTGLASGKGLVLVLVSLQ